MKRILLLILVTLPFYGSGQFLTPTYKLKLSGGIAGQSGPPFKQGSASIYINGSQYRSYGPVNKGLTINETTQIFTPSKIEFKQRSIVGNFPPRCDSNTTNGPYNLTTAITSSSIGIYGCGFVTLNAQLIPNIGSIFRVGGATGDVCINQQLALGATNNGHPSEAYNWQYTADGLGWIDFPSTFNQKTLINATIQEIVGANHVNLLGKTITFRVGGYGKGQFSNNTLSVKYAACAPLLTSIDYTPPTCSGNPITVSVNFNRPLKTGEKFDSVSILDAANNNPLFQQRDVSMNGTKFTFNPINTNAFIDGQTLKVQYQMKIGNVLVPGFINSTQTFTFKKKAPVTFTISKTDPKCPSGKGSITLSDVKGGNGGYSYSLNAANWVAFSGGNTTIPNVNPGKNSVIIKDNKGCVSTTKEITIANPPGPINIAETVGITTYFGGNNGFINVAVNGGNGGYLYNWTGPNNYSSSQMNINNLYAGVYTLTVTDSKGCSTSKNIEVVQPKELFLNTPEITRIDCYGRENGIISITAQGGFEEMGGTAKYTFELLKENMQGVYEVLQDKTVTTETLKNFRFSNNNLSEGNYKVRLTENVTIPSESNVVKESGVLEITSPNAPIEFTITDTTNVLCKGEATGSATVTITGGWNDYITEWYKDGEVYTTAQNPTNLVAGTYILIVKAATINPDSSTCQAITPIAQGEITITEPAEKLEINTTKVTSPTAGNADGGIIIEATGGITPYTYMWNTGETSPAITNIPDGTYTITTTDANGCIAIKEYILEELSVTITATPGEELLCHGNLAGLTANPIGGDKQYTYAWYNQNDPATVIGTASTIQGLVEGNYIVTVTDDNGSGTLVTSPVYSIVEPALLEYDVVTTPVTCYGGNDGSLTINAKGGTGTLQYSIDNGANYQESNIFTDISGGLYPVLVKDANNCTTEQKEHLVYAPDPIQIVETVTQVGIYGQNTGMIELQVSGGNGGFTYNWTGPNGFTAMSKDITDLYIGTYTVVIKDANFDAIVDNAGCTTTQTFTITQPDKLEVVMGYETLYSDLKCYGDDNARLLATVTGGVQPYAYVWLKENASGSFEPLTENSSLLMGVDAGTYRVDITDKNTATVSSDVFIVSQPDQLVVEDSTTKVICFGEATGAIDLTISGGTPPYTIVWENGETTEDRNNLSAGNYTVEVKDNNECTVNKTIEVAHAYEEFAITNVEVYDVSVFDGDDGAIVPYVTGGATPYTYVWTRVSDGSIVGRSDIIRGMKAGDYHVSITDAEGCSIAQTYSIAEPDIVVATLVDPVCIDDCNGSITLVVDEGNGNFTYLWNTGERTATITGLCKGTYSVTIEGFGNRILERTYTLRDPDPLIIGLGDDKTLCKDQSYVLDATIEDALATYVWQSDNGFSATKPKIEVSESGVYTVFVTTEIGCVSQESIKITAIEDTIVSDFIVSSDLFVDESFTIVNLSNPVPDRIAWDIPDTVEILENTQQYAEIKCKEAGTYTIGMRTYIGECEEYLTKKIVVRERSLANEDNPLEGLQEYMLFPNPTSGNFTVNLTFDKETTIDLKLFNLSNNTMIKNYQNTGKEKYTIPFELEGTVPSGLYFLVLEVPGKSYLRKIIVE